MRGKKLPWLALLGAALIALLAGAGPGAAIVTQEEEPTVEERVLALEELVSAQSQRIADLEEALAKLAVGLDAGTRELELAIAFSRHNGFEWAGPNPRARTDVLEGLRSFSGELRGALGIEPVVLELPEETDEQ